MSGLSLSHTRSIIDRLGDLDNEISRHCRAAQLQVKGVSGDTSVVDEACKALEVCQQQIREAKQALLDYDGFLQGRRQALREALEHPRLGGKAAVFFNQIGQRVVPAIETHAGGLIEEGIEALRHLGAAVRAVLATPESEADANQAKECLKALKKTLAAAEKAVEKAVKVTAQAEMKVPAMGETEEVIEVERLASFGYQLTENQDSEPSVHGYSLT